MKFREDSKEMYLCEYFPGVSIDEIVENTGFPLDASRAVEAAAPNADQLWILRQEVDPQRLICHV
jgi:glutaconate CoA-transferase subunit B